MRKTLFLFLVFFTAGFIPGANAQNLPTQTSNLFSGSGNCALCHQPGSPNTSALLNIRGEDVSPVTLWRSTMMANAAKDPFWQAKVSAEVTANPHLRSVIEDKCTTCHSPLGRTEAIFKGSSSYTMAEMNADPLAMDGVSCTACHQIKADNLGKPESYSGHYLIQNDRIIYGPFENPLTMPMQNQTNYTPRFGEQTHQSELCATCHTLFTPYVNNTGQVVGQAPEQTPYLEWKNSIFPKNDKQCQSCHMPDLDEPVVIANRPRSLGGRSPFAQHHFVGGNLYMLRLIRANGPTLGVTATTTQLDSTIARTERMLRTETADLSASYNWTNPDTLEIRVAVKNKTGHKFPTAYPSRRVWLELRLDDRQGRTLFASGIWNADSGDIANLEIPYEPHHAVIRSPKETQIYQSVMKDVDGKVNYTLLRAAGYLKDNRIPPEGFRIGGAAYDSTQILGKALLDSNFNRNGSGTDTTIYRIGGVVRGKTYTVTVKLNYQSLSPRFVKDLFRYNTPQVQAFRSYYEKTPNVPFTLDSLQKTITTTSAGEKSGRIPQSQLLVQAYPNPFNPQVHVRIQVPQKGNLTVQIYNTLGKRIRTLYQGQIGAGELRLTWTGTSRSGLPVPSGSYLLRASLDKVHGAQPLVTTQKLLLLK